MNSSTAEFLLARIKVVDGCWRWQRRVRKGYGELAPTSARPRGLSTLAHRAMWQTLVGPIPEGMTLDHLCHNESETCEGGNSCLHRRCVNPDHLALATRSENSKAPRPTHCPQGHAYDEPNTYWWFGRGFPERRCRACTREATRRYRAKQEVSA